MASAGYSNPLPWVAILERLGMAKATEHHRFRPYDVSLTDVEVFNHTELLGPKQITEISACAGRQEQQPTCDLRSGNRPTVVVGASAEHLVQLSG